MDPFSLNIAGVQDLVESGINKTQAGEDLQEGVQGEEIDALDLTKSDDELLVLRDRYEAEHAKYEPKIKPRQDKNKLYYAGKQRRNGQDPDKVVSSNLIFEAEETFIPQALSKNPEPVVFSDNTEEGKTASNALKTMHQYHADVLCLRKKLGIMVRQWSVYYIGVIKHGWDKKTNDIKLDLRRPQNFVLDPNGYVDEYGNFIGWLGERITSTAGELIDLYPEHKDYVASLITQDGKPMLGTEVVRTEWWDDDFFFVTYTNKVLDKGKNPYFNYQGEASESATPTINHFGTPKMPYTFLSVFSLQEAPHDITNLIEQNISNQDRISDRDDQITKNLRTGNNSLALSMLHGWTSENAAEGAAALENGDPILTPGEADEKAIRRLPASPLPAGLLQAQEVDKDTLRGVFGTRGLSVSSTNEDNTARGKILDQSHDSTRIGGGIGDSIEQVADNIFNWWTQLYAVFYDVKHYAAVMGTGHAVEYVQLINTDLVRKFVVSVAPNSMKPHDELSEMNQAIELWGAKAIDPIGLYKKLNDPDPMESAKRLVLWTVNPQQYLMTYFPEQAPMLPQGGAPQPGLGGNSDIEGGQPSLSAPPANANLSEVPLNK